MLGVRMAVTIKDVARAAGFSVATVSRVLNASGPVKPETVRRVREVALSLRYAPNGAARSLTTRKTSTLGVLLPDLHGEFFSEVIRGIDATAHEHGYHILVSSSHNEPEEIAATLAAMRGRVDGVIIMSPAIEAAALAHDLPNSIPVVLLNCKGTGHAYDALGVDNYGGAFAMTEHLLAMGRTRIAMITGPAGNADAEERLQGYRDALRDAGIARAAELELHGDFHEQAGYAAAQRALALAPRPDALFGANDVMAIGALSALRERGVRVPEEMSVVGFDDISMARYMNPPLTPVRVNIAELGNTAVNTLVNAIRTKNAHERRRQILSAALVVRGSCGAGARPP